MPALLLAAALALPADFEKMLQRVDAAQLELQNGRATSFKALWSQADDVTLSGGLGGAIQRGWPAVSERLDWVATQFAEGRHENRLVTAFASGDLGYVVQTEKLRYKVPGEGTDVARDYRVTMIFRREKGEWRMVHRQADASTVQIPPAASSTGAAPLRQPVTGYAPVNGLRMYYEVHGAGDPLVLLHGSFMTVTNNWAEAIPRLSRSRRVIAVEMQGHGRTADIDRDFGYDVLADDVAALLDHLEIAQADLLGYSMGGGVALQVAIRHPTKVGKVVSISAVSRHDGWVKEALAAFPGIDAAMLAGSPIETEYKKLSPTPDRFPTFVKRVIQMDLKPYEFGAEKLAATKAPILFIHGDADGVRLDHIAEMFRLKGGDVFGDMQPRSESQLAILPDTTHVTLMQKWDAITPLVEDFLGARRTR